jgi:hypothetical protein
MRNSLLDMNSVFLFNTAQKVLYDLEILKILSTLVLGLILMIKKIKYLREKTEQENMSNLR